MFYTHGQLDRADQLRKEQSQLEALQRSKHAIVIPVWRGKMLVHNNRENVPCMTTILGSELLDDPANTLFLGMIDTQPVFALSVSQQEEHALTHLVDLASASIQDNTPCRFDDLRVVGPNLAANEGALMAYARGLAHWHDTCQFCSRCGHPLHSHNGGHIKVCENQQCTHQTFPRTDPAVIMLVTKPAKEQLPEMSLLGRNPAWPVGVFSTLAGFVETGESLEQAVQREVFEESGIRTTHVQYVASQPWPFPRSIMLGFEAVATTDDIKLDPIELEDAQWFTREQLKTFGTWGDERYEFQLPRPDSIARFLIDRWIADY